MNREDLHVYNRVAALVGKESNIVLVQLCVCDGVVLPEAPVTAVRVTNAEGEVETAAVCNTGYSSIATGVDD